MAEPQTEPAPRHYDPLWDEGKKKKGMGATIGITISIIAHVALVFYLWKTKIEPRYVQYSDEAVKVDLVKPQQKPPPPPPPPPPGPGA